MDFYKQLCKQAQNEESTIMLIEQSYNYWKSALFEKCVRMFTWNGLPNNIPQREIEMRLISEGYCGFVNDKKVGYMVASGTLNGVTQYNDVFTNFTYASPTAYGGSPLIGRDCVVISNNAIRYPLYTMICRYASLLAHCDITLKVGLVNLRETNTFKAESESTAESIRAYHKKSYNGELDVIIDSSMIDAVKNMVNNGASHSLGIMDIVDVRNELLRMFFNEIGVRYTRDKKERMIESEVNNDEQLLLLNIADMKRKREEACKELYNIFGINVSVELSEEFKIIGGGEYDENNN